MEQSLQYQYVCFLLCQIRLVRIHPLCKSDFYETFNIPGITRPIYIYASNVTEHSLITAFGLLVQQQFRKNLSFVSWPGARAIVW